MRVVVVHPYQQHSYKTAVAVQSSGHLTRYITTVYDKKGSWTNIGKKLLHGDNLQRANGRRDEQLDDNKVMLFCESLMLGLLLWQRIDKNRKYYYYFREQILKTFNKKVGKYIKKNNIDIVILYDTVSWDLVEYLKKHTKTKIVIDMSAASCEYMDAIFKKEIYKKSRGSDVLIKEINKPLYKNNLRHSSIEIKNADSFLVASEFTKKSVQYCGIDEKKIHICRYGFDSDIIANIDQKKTSKYRCLFIGNVDQRKGFAYFEKIISYLPSDVFEFHILGAFDSESDFYKKNVEKCIFHGFVSREEVIRNCLVSDFILHTSLADGFGFSVLEAMACGCIPVVSENTGICDIIRNGENGFVFKFDSIEVLSRKIIELVDTNINLNILKDNARKTATSLTWEKYNEEVLSALIKINH